MATIKDVARLADVSPSTVSRVLSQKVFVDESTKLRVMAAVQDLNYQPNPLARALRERKTNTIALLVPGIENQIWPLVARGVENVARKQGYVVVLCNTDNDVEMEINYINRLKRQWVEGIIIAPAKDESPHLRELSSQGFPVVQVIRGLENDGMDTVMIDNFKLAYEAVSYLIKTGHKHIAIASGRQDLYLYRRRLDGYKQALLDHGYPIETNLILQEIKELNNLYRLTQQRIKNGVVMDGLVATSDPKAIVVMRALRDMGLNIPSDVSVIGMDNIEQSSYFEPQLTTMAQPFIEMGKLAAQKLIFRINDPEHAVPVTDYLTPELIIRKSTR
jgi:LacI family transcriptional regulator